MSMAVVALTRFVIETSGVSVFETLEERRTDRVGKVLFGQCRIAARRQFANGVEPDFHRLG